MRSSKTSTRLVTGLVKDLAAAQHAYAAAVTKIVTSFSLPDIETPECARLVNSLTKAQREYADGSKDVVGSLDKCVGDVRGGSMWAVDGVDGVCVSVDDNHYRMNGCMYV